MIFLAAIRAEKSIAEKTVLDSQRQYYAALFTVCCLLAAVALQYITTFTQGCNNRHNIFLWKLRTKVGLIIDFYMGRTLVQMKLP